MVFPAVGRGPARARSGGGGGSWQASGAHAAGQHEPLSSPIVCMYTPPVFSLPDRPILRTSPGSTSRLTKKSSPMVCLYEFAKLSFVKRVAIEVLPTAPSPSRMTCNGGGW